MTPLMTARRPPALTAQRASGRAGRRPRRDLPCQVHDDPDLWFAEFPDDLERAKALCGTCPVRGDCLAGALRRGEPCGVWGGEIVQQGRVIPFKRGRGRPRIHHPAAGADPLRKYA